MAYPTGTFGFILDLLAEMGGFPNYLAASGAPNEQTFMREAVNTAYRQSYWPRNDDLRRAFAAPNWASDLFGVTFKAPTTGNVAVVQGSKELVDDGVLKMTENDVGSIIEIGLKHYTLKGVDQNGNNWLVEPMDQPTATYGATCYFCSTVLCPEITRLLDMPLIVGGMVLSPLTGRGEADLRNNIVFPDFILSGSNVAVGMFSINVNDFYIKGNPISFYVETLPNYWGEMRQRLVVWPLPDGLIGERSCRFRANYMPKRLVNLTDKANLPVDTIMDCLYPMARYIYATLTRRFLGDTQRLKDEYDSAVAYLNSFVPQQKKPINYEHHGITTGLDHYN